ASDFKVTHTDVSFGVFNHIKGLLIILRTDPRHHTDGSAISAYMFLLKNVRPAVATSYAYVNPVVAVLLGIGFAGESLSTTEWCALAVIVSAVILVTLGKFLFKPR
ncbi:MAG: EamA family transporter, partial [Yersinia sp. (in: enterobacteria)]